MQQMRASDFRNDDSVSRCYSLKGCSQASPRTWRSMANADSMPGCGAAGSAACSFRPPQCFAAIPRWGVSLEGLRVFIEFHGGGRAALEGLTTADVCEAIVKPRSAAARKSFLETHALPAGPATVFVSHAWSTPFLTLVDAIGAWEEEHSSAGKAYYWVDLLANDQHDACERPYEWWTTVFMQLIREIGTLVLVLEYQQPRPLQRAWCLFELFSAASAGATFHVAMRRQDEQQFCYELLMKFDTLLSRLAVDVSKAEATKPIDRERIMAAIEAAVGTERLNSHVVMLLRSWMAKVGHDALLKAVAGPADDSLLALHLSTALLKLLLEHDSLADVTHAFEATVAAARAADGPTPKSIAATSFLAQLLREQGRVEEAERYLRDTLRDARLVLERDHPLTLGAAERLGCALQDEGKLSEAVDLLQAAAAGYARRYGSEHVDTARARERVAACKELLSATAASGDVGGDATATGVT